MRIFIFSEAAQKIFQFAKRQANFYAKRTAQKRETSVAADSRINILMPRSFYLPELHPFEHIATAHWPLKFTAYNQLDWIAAVDEMELWLNTHIGSHYSTWAYHNGTSIDYWQACIAFKKPTYKTLFLLQWT